MYSNVSKYSLLHIAEYNKHKNLSAMAAKRIIWFLLITFSFSWLLWIPQAFIESGFWIPSISMRESWGEISKYGAWGPLIGAISCIWIFEGRSKLVQIIKSAFRWKMGKVGYLAFLLFPLMIGGALLLHSAVGGEEVALVYEEGLPHYIIAFVFILILGGPLQEEFGWRGYLFRLLEKPWTAMGAGAFSGFIWGLWHLPLFYIPREEFYYNKPMWGLFLTTIMVGIILSWLYKRSNYSMLIVLIGHAMFNWSNYVFPTLGYDLASWILFGFYAIVIAYILFNYDWKNFERKGARNASTEINVIAEIK